MASRWAIVAGEELAWELMAERAKKHEDTRLSK